MMPLFTQIVGDPPSAKAVSLESIHDTSLGSLSAYDALFKQTDGFRPVMASLEGFLNGRIRALTYTDCLRSNLAWARNSRSTVGAFVFVGLVSVYLFFADGVDDYVEDLAIDVCKGQIGENGEPRCSETCVNSDNRAPSCSDCEECIEEKKEEYWKYIRWSFLFIIILLACWMVGLDKALVSAWHILRGGGGRDKERLDEASTATTGFRGLYNKARARL